MLDMGMDAERPQKKIQRKVEVSFDLQHLATKSPPKNPKKLAARRNTFDPSIRIGE
jgi:hypothetical protein